MAQVPHDAAKDPDVDIEVEDRKRKRIERVRVGDELEVQDREVTVHAGELVVGAEDVVVREVRSEPVPRLDTGLTIWRS